MRKILTSKSREFKTQVSTLMDTLMTQALALQNVEHMDATGFDMLKQCQNPVKTASDIVTACAEVVAETNHNTEKILALLKHTYDEEA
jgi:hypothetical protein